MSKDLDNLVRKINCKKLSTELVHEFYPYGEEGYNELVKVLDSNSDSSNEIPNALLIIFDLVGKSLPDKAGESLVLARNFTQSSQVKVRSAAVRAMIGILYLNLSNPEFYRIENEVRVDALELLNRMKIEERNADIGKHIEAFLNKNNSQK